ncbi:MipA/OmpV family protein [Xanthobacter sp. KR7-65]|uniref:MipA/OmpV family protein n=1 Tax=Xanthobacter sp. KR7-65 TaxID=3156612 RepID=UPI0032B5D2E3
MPDAQAAPAGAFPACCPSFVPLAAIGTLMLTVARGFSAELAATDATQPSAASLFQAPTLDRLAFVGEKLAEWKVVLGGGALIAPKFEGSDEYEVSPVPFVSAAFGDWMTFDPRGATVGLRPIGGVHLSARLGYDTGRQKDDSAHLRGLGDIDFGAVLGVRAAYQAGPLEFYTALDRIVGGSDGLQARFGADASFSYERFRITAGISATWSDETYMSAYFGVTPLQSLRSGLPIYSLGAGLKRFDVTAAATYMVTDKWLVRGQAGFGYLLGDAGDSPIVQSKSQPSGMLTIGYRF